MAAQWDIQQALTDLRVEMNDRFDKLETAALVIAVARTELEGRVKSLEEKAGWLGWALGTGMVGICGLFVAWVKDHWR